MEAIIREMKIVSNTNIRMWKIMDSFFLSMHSTLDVWCGLEQDSRTLKLKRGSVPWAQ